MICGSSAGIDYVPKQTASALFDLLLIDGSKITLQKYIKLFAERYDSCVCAGFVFGTPEVKRDAVQRYCDKYGINHARTLELVGNSQARAEEMVVTQIFFQRCRSKYNELQHVYKNDYRLHNWNNFPGTGSSERSRPEFSEM